MDDRVDEGGQAESVKKAGSLLQGDHIPSIDPDAGQSASWAVSSDEPPHHPTDVAVDDRSEQGGHKLHYCNFGAVLSLLPAQSQAQPAGTGAFRKGALDEEGEGEDGVVDQDEGGEDDPVELVDETEGWSPVLHQTVVGVEDEESPEDYVEKHGVHINIARGEPCLNVG